MFAEIRHLLWKYNAIQLHKQEYKPEQDLIETLSNSMLQHGPPQARLYIGICCDDTEQGSHVGVDHATALGYAPNPHLLALQVELHHMQA